MNTFEIVFWSFTVCFVSLFGGVSYQVYHKNKEQVFKYYAYYTFTLILFLLLKAPVLGGYLHQWVTGGFLYVYNWFIQIVYLNFLILFGLYFLKINENYPRLTAYIKTYVIICFFVSVLIFVLDFFTSINLYLIYFLYVFIPIELLIGITVLYLGFKVYNPIKYFFYSGIIGYLLLAFTALYISLSHVNTGFIEPIVFFYWGIMLESSVFSLGLTYRVKRVYDQKIEIQKELNKTQKQLHQELEKQLDLKQKENLYLQQQKEKQELKLEISTLSSRVFRSQMNSHFIFNVLNSIKFFILQNDLENAALYLSKFAKFIRKILDGSMNDYISLKEEIKSIELYLSIEQMRFNYELDYSMSIDENVNIQEYKIPSLLLQPFVENALWHGLREKEGDKKLSIRILQHNTKCKILIEDNGVGRTKSLKKHNPLNQKSYGLKIVQNRIDIINKVHNLNIHFEIKDLEQGTLVTVFL